MSTLKSRHESEQPTMILMVNDKPHCNMACHHCYLPYEGVRSPEATLELVDKFRNDFRIIIAGSETLTDLEYLEAYRRADQKYILTNGLLLFQKPELFDRLREYGIEELQISLHFGIQEDLHSVPERIVRHVVAQAKERGFRTQIAVTITLDNFEMVGDICDQVHNMGGNGVSFIKYIKSGSAKEDGKRVLTDEERQRFFHLVDDVRERYDKTELMVKIQGNFGPKEGTKGEELAKCNEYCPAGVNFFVIDPNDTVYGCPFLMEHPIGELTDDLRLRISKNLCDGARHKCLTDIL
ncbi:hypothetical protein COY07_04365 [Candidatus Peregrinibacteria bacterium CG_4_10_14_0_2_um_filter_43_11]|nr:MAG: hypothetical protein COY07_04365 [Candidatus Peregrinibacteria bacterium CG_4_10_14_0_2_um_filter_43_11]